MPRISSKNQVTIPVDALEKARLRAGDEVTIEAIDEDQIVLRRVPADLRQAFGALTGMYGPDYLKKLREEDGW